MQLAARRRGATIANNCATKHDNSLSNDMHEGIDQMSLMAAMPQGWSSSLYRRGSFPFLRFLVASHQFLELKQMHVGKPGGDLLAQGFDQGVVAEFALGCHFLNVNAVSKAMTTSKR
jgi:hypothetical protein